MGCVETIGMERFPTQSDWVGRRVEVCFFYDTSHTIGGEIIRDDEESPNIMLIKLDDGRVLLSTECQYSFPKEIKI